MAKDLDIIQAVKDNDLAVLQKLLQKCAKTSKNKIIGNTKKLNVNFQDGDGMSALHQAALMSNAVMVKTLLDHGAAPNLRDNKGMIALHYATWQGMAQPVQLLLQRGSPVNEQALNGETPLHLASQHGHFDVATLLLNQHADPTICNKNLRTSLDLACEFGRARVTELLLRSNLCQKLLEDSPTDNLDNERTTCLHLAARNGHVDIIKLLLQAGVNINRSTLKGTCLHAAALAGKTDVVRLLLECGVDVNRPDSYDQTALDIVSKFTGGHACKELKHLLKEASCAVYARAIKDFSNVYDPGSLAFKEGDILTVYEQRADGIWRGNVISQGRPSKTGMFPANHVVLIDSKVVSQQLQQQAPRPGQMYSQVPDLLNRGALHSGGGGDRGSLGSTGTEDSNGSSSSHPSTPHSFPSTPSSGFPPPPNSLMTSYPPPPRGHLTREPSGADSGFSSSQSLPQHTPSSPAGPPQYQFPKGPPHGNTANGNIPHLLPNGAIPGYSLHPHHPQQQQQHADWSPAPAYQTTGVGVGAADLRGASPAKDSPAHSNRNSAASSDSGRGFSTGHAEAKPVHNYVNVHVTNHQHRFSGQSYESGVSSRQSYHSTSSSSHGSLDRLEDPGLTSTINVTQLIQAGVPDSEVLHAWLHDLNFEEYYPLFIQAGYDMPTISRMTPEDLTAIGITKPAHRKRLKAEIARLHIHDGIPDYRPNDLMEWLHLLGLGTYLDTLCDQGYENMDDVLDITWEDLEEIGIQKLGHQKKIMLAIDRLKRITSGSKRLSSVDGRTASLELLEPPPPAPPISARWSGEITAIPPHVYDSTVGGARPKKSSSGDSISTNSSGNSAGSGGIVGGGEMRVIPLPREDAGMAGAIPHRQTSTSSIGNAMQPDVVAIQVKRTTRSSTSEDKDPNGQSGMYKSFQGPVRRPSDSGDVFSDSECSYPPVVIERRKSESRIMSTSEHEHHNSEFGNVLQGANTSGMMSQSLNSNVLRRDSKEHIYDTPQIPPNHGKPYANAKPLSTAEGIAGPLHINTGLQGSAPARPSPPGGRGGKKVPPPPPKRTHSIRDNSNQENSAPPASPKPAHGTPSSNLQSSSTPPGSVITVSASIHPHPHPSPAKQPPPVSEKPLKMGPPVVASKPIHHPQQQPQQLQQQQQQRQPQQPPQKPQSQQQQQQQQQQQGQLQLKSHPLPAVAPKPLSPKPVQSQKINLQANSGQPQPPVFNKPKLAGNPSQQQALHQQPLRTSTNLTAKLPHQQHSPVHHQQQPQQHSIPIPPHPHRSTDVSLSSSPSKSLGSEPNSIIPQQGLQPSQGQQLPTQGFASCVKSLSEKFGKKSIDETEEDQFPDNVSTDSDDFPPPPPPIAMDIITPKIHNYGIPSKDPPKPGFVLAHQRDYPHNKEMSSSSMQSPQRRNFSPHLQSNQADTGNQRRLNTSLSETVRDERGPIVTSPQIPPLPHGLSAIRQQQQQQQQKLQQPDLVVKNSSSSGDHEHNSGATISNEKRSESTMSFESTSSGSSVDSNTLPFANENVGTIKQRAANAKPSIVQSDVEDGHKNVDLNPNMFDHELQNVAGISNSSKFQPSQLPSSVSSYHPPGSNIHNQKSSVPGTSHVSNAQQLNQRSFGGIDSKPKGAIHPTEPSKKPAVSPKPNRPKPEVTPSKPKAVVDPTVSSSSSSTNVPKGKSDSGNVLCDIDNMLQDLTDELDAMLEEEMVS